MSNLVHIFKNLFIFRFQPPDIDSELCNEFEEKICYQLLSYSGDSDSEDDNYYEWEAVSYVISILHYISCKINPH